MLKKHIFFAVPAFLACLTGSAFSQAATPYAPKQYYEGIPQEQSTSAVMFTPPPAWRHADSNALPEHVKIMVVGKGGYEFPPSISLATELYRGTLKQYLKRIREINASQGNQWKDLGNIKTEAGYASLSQVDKRTEWGEVRMMHVMLLKDGTMYIMTAAALKDEFPRYYKEIFNALRSLRFGIINTN